MNPINVTGYAPTDYTVRENEIIFHQRPGGHRKMKIHLVVANGNSGAEQHFLVKAHTKAGAEKFVSAKFKPIVVAFVPSQEELVDALQKGVPIEDATNSPQASIPEPAQTLE